MDQDFEILANEGIFLGGEFRLQLFACLHVIGAELSVAFGRKDGDEIVEAAKAFLGGVLRRILRIDIDQDLRVLITACDPGGRGLGERGTTHQQGRKESGTHRFRIASARVYVEGMNVPNDGMATVFRSSGFSAEMEADTVKEVLESNGVPAIVTGLDVLPGAHEVVIQVAAERKEEAERLLAEALQAGPAAAEEAEAASEEPK